MRQAGRFRPCSFGNVHVGHISASKESGDVSLSLLLFCDPGGPYKDRANLTLTRDNRAVVPFAVRFAGLCGYPLSASGVGPIVTPNRLNVPLILIAASIGYYDEAEYQRQLKEGVGPAP